MDFNDKAPGKGAGGGRRRRRRRRSRGGRGGGGGGGGNNAKAPSILDVHDDRLRARGGQSTQTGPEQLEPFNLFCAYHLGITRNNGYKFQSVGEVARRFNTDPGVIKKKLVEFGIDSEALRGLGFEGEYAQLDIKVAPEGVSRRALAMDIWREFEAELVVQPPEPAVVPTKMAEPPEMRDTVAASEHGLASDGDNQDAMAGSPV